MQGMHGIALERFLVFKTGVQHEITVGRLQRLRIDTNIQHAGDLPLQTFKAFLDKVTDGGKALVVTPEVNENVILSARNIPGVKTTIATILSTYDVMNAGTFIVDKAALQKIEEVYA